ncbi:MAG: diguanylate cyclase [Bryobacteraceae bacterium]|nr:diguanylate cyclase [Bryobacteraceae bacterium]
MKVLIADDSPVSRRLLEAALRKWKYDVLVACDGLEAWEYLQRDNTCRLAILDWMMPGLSGPEVCRRVRQLAADRYIYILLITSRTHKEDLIEGMEAGADDYLTKPFDQDELKVRLGPGRRIVELQDALLEAHAALREQATTDALTRIWNRRTILEILDRELSRAQRAQSATGIVMGDLDHFKLINDTYGHIAGDGVLREVARRMKASSRAYDSIGRYGGEEFLLILPSCNGHDTEALAERMRQAIESRPVELPEVSIPVTTSFGVTSVPDIGAGAPESLLRIADSALYQAKQQGRNRVVYAPFAPQ